MLCLLLSVSLGGCWGKAKFLRELELMNDEELLYYYQGINEQIRDIDRGMRVEEHLDDRQQEGEDRVRWDSSFFLGSKGYELNKKKTFIEKELIKRNIIP